MLLIQYTYIPTLHTNTYTTTHAHFTSCWDRLLDILGFEGPYHDPELMPSCCSNTALANSHQTIMFCRYTTATATPATLHARDSPKGKGQTRSPFLLHLSEKGHPPSTSFSKFSKSLRRFRCLQCSISRWSTRQLYLWLEATSEYPPIVCQTPDSPLLKESPATTKGLGNLTVTTKSLEVSILVLFNHRVHPKRNPSVLIL